MKAVRKYVGLSIVDKGIKHNTREKVAFEK